MYGYPYFYGPHPMYRQRITKEQAREIALAQVPGRVLHIDVDLENGVLVYEVFILTPNNIVVEVDILAKTGQIINIEQENDFD